MPTFKTLAFACRRTRQWLLIACVLVVLYLPATVWAASSELDVEGPNCAQCHPDQATTWQVSAHAQVSVTNLQTGVTCETCHGAYVPNHPQDGTMQVSVDGSACADCHTTTYEQWHDTAHSGVGVQCTSCHVPHSQATRLSSDALCESCHREEAEHWVHHEAGVHCPDCHVALPSDDYPGTGSAEADLRVMAGAKAPDHRFELSVGACAGCHADSIHDTKRDEATGQIETSQVFLMTGRAKELSIELQDAKRTNRTLQTVSVASLGFGLGAGGVLGAIFVLVVGYIIQGRARK